MNEWRKIYPREKQAMAERCLKVFIYILHRDYGFGKKRAREYYEKCGKFLEQMDTNEIFWEQLDRVVIDKLGLSDFQRDYTEHNKAVRD